MTRLFAGCAVATLILAGCGGTPHGPPSKSAASALTADQPAPPSPGGGVKIMRAGTPHGPPRVLSKAITPAAPSLPDDIADAYEDGSYGGDPAATALRDCKLQHLRALHKAEAFMRGKYGYLSPKQSGDLEDWLDYIGYRVYPEEPSVPAPTAADLPFIEFPPPKPGKPQMTFPPACVQ